MSRKRWIKFGLMTAFAGAVLATLVVFGHRQMRMDSGRQNPPLRAVPVEVADIERRPMEWQRTFSGTMEAPSQFVIAPKVGGRVKRLNVNLADVVTRGQVVAELDNDEYIQEVARAKAELAVAGANLTEAASALEIAGRDLQRITRLRERGVASEANLDTARANQLAKKAQLEVARAGVTRAGAALETARIRLGYTRVNADWNNGDGDRVVAERFVDEGETVSANTPLLRIVELDPLLAVIFVTEKDYGKLQPGQEVSLTTDAYPGQLFVGRIARVAPVFRESTRQARVEVTVANPKNRLKPGMFIRATVSLDRVEDAIVIPEQALTTRNDRTGIFLVSDDGQTALWREVNVGIRADGRAQITGAEPGKQVITLGQQLIDDGSPIHLPGEQASPPASTTATEKP